MQRKRVINFAANMLRFQIVKKQVSSFCANDKLIVHVATMGKFNG